jgi:hypothetical protein
MMEAKEPCFKSPFFTLNSIGGKRLVAEFECIEFVIKRYLNYLLAIRELIFNLHKLASVAYPTYRIEILLR